MANFYDSLAQLEETMNQVRDEPDRYAALIQGIRGAMSRTLTTADRITPGVHSQVRAMG